MKFRILSSVESRRVVRPLAYWLERLGYGPTLVVLPAYQLLQQLVSQRSEAAPDLDIVLVDAELWNAAAPEISQALDERIQTGGGSCVGWCARRQRPELPALRPRA